MRTRQSLLTWSAAMAPTSAVSCIPGRSSSDTRLSRYHVHKNDRTTFTLPKNVLADPGRRQLAEELLHLAAPKLTAHNRLLVLIDAVHLEDMLGGIQTNPDNRHGTAPLAVLHTITAWHD